MALSSGEDTNSLIRSLKAASIGKGAVEAEGVLHHSRRNSSRKAFDLADLLPPATAASLPGPRFTTSGAPPAATAGGFPTIGGAGHSGQAHAATTATSAAQLPSLPGAAGASAPSPPARPTATHTASPSAPAAQPGSAPPNIIPPMTNAGGSSKSTAPGALPSLPSPVLSPSGAGPGPSPGGGAPSSRPSAPLSPLPTTASAPTHAATNLATRTPSQPLPSLHINVPSPASNVPPTSLPQHRQSAPNVSSASAGATGLAPTPPAGSAPHHGSDTQSGGSPSSGSRSKQAGSLLRQGSGEHSGSLKLIRAGGHELCGPAPAPPAGAHHHSPPQSARMPRASAPGSLGLPTLPPLGGGVHAAPLPECGGAGGAGAQQPGAGSSPQRPGRPDPLLKRPERPAPAPAHSAKAAQQQALPAGPPPGRTLQPLASPPLPARGGAAAAPGGAGPVSVHALPTLPALGADTKGARRPSTAQAIAEGDASSISTATGAGPLELTVRGSSANPSASPRGNASLRHAHEYGGFSLGPALGLLGKEQLEATPKLFLGGAPPAQDTVTLTPHPPVRRQSAGDIWHPSNDITPQLNSRPNSGDTRHLSGVVKWGGPNLTGDLNLHLPPPAYTAKQLEQQQQQQQQQAPHPHSRLGVSESGLRLGSGHHHHHHHHHPGDGNGSHANGHAGGFMQALEAQAHHREHGRVHPRAISEGGSLDMDEGAGLPPDASVEVLGSMWAHAQAQAHHGASKPRYADVSDELESSTSLGAPLPLPQQPAPAAPAKPLSGPQARDSFAIMSDGDEVRPGVPPPAKQEESRSAGSMPLKALGAKATSFAFPHMAEMNTSVRMMH